VDERCRALTAFGNAFPPLVPAFHAFGSRLSRIFRSRDLIHA
jgi:hypothetical protein